MEMRWSRDTEIDDGDISNRQVAEVRCPPQHCGRSIDGSAEEQPELSDGGVLCTNDTADFSSLRRQERRQLSLQHRAGHAT